MCDNNILLLGLVIIIVVIYFMQNKKRENLNCDKGVNYMHTEAADLSCKDNCDCDGGRWCNVNTKKCMGLAR
jgi:hypothetical protein